MDHTVGIYQDKTIQYPSVDDDFRPDTLYPEYSKHCFQSLSNHKNATYEAVRNAFILMGYDAEHIGCEDWNPLKTCIKKGDTVLIKPNLVMHKKYGGGSTESLYTHPSVVAPVIDYCILALMDESGNVSGKIVVGDSPMQSCDFEVLIEESGYKRLTNYYKRKGIRVELRDFRNLRSVGKLGINIQEQVKNGGKLIDLGNNSAFATFSEKKLRNLRVTNYDPRELQSHCTLTKHEYRVADELVEADVIINMPKPKTHRKAGVTIALKNMVGICTDKDYLPHHTLGAKEQQGDAYLKKSCLLEFADRIVDWSNMCVKKKCYWTARGLVILQRSLSKLAGLFVKNDYREGSWYGNDTIWRTVYDLNRICFTADKSCALSDHICRRMLVIADMIVAGENNGPLEPDPKPCGIIAVGENPVSFDEIICSLMGLTCKAYPIINHLFDPEVPLPKELQQKGKIISNVSEWDQKIADTLRREESLHFVPNPSWCNVEN